MRFCRKKNSLCICLEVLVILALVVAAFLFLPCTIRPILSPSSQPPAARPPLRPPLPHLAERGVRRQRPHLPTPVPGQVRRGAVEVQGQVPLQGSVPMAEPVGEEREFFKKNVLRK